MDEECKEQVELDIEFCDLEDLPFNKKDRIKGEKYYYNNEVRIWDGRKLKCEHNKLKNDCKSCSGSSFCIHDKFKKYCIECLGSAMCMHNRRKTVCHECQGSSICIHNKIKNKCRDCKGSSICVHNKIKHECRDCKGSGRCIHNILKQKCRTCFTHPQNFCKHCANVYIKESSYKPYCFKCYCVLNPDEEIPHRYMMKENYIHNYLKENLNISIIHNKVIEGGCSKRRPDWLIDVLTHSVIIECDEEKHEGYECENKRTMEIFQDLGSRPIVLIRFNPDKNGDSGSCFAFDKKNKITPTSEWDERKEKLLETIRYHINTIPEKEVTIEYLYYSEEKEIEDEADI